MTLVRRGTLLVTVFILVLLVAAGAALAAKPTRVIIITMDQMRPEYAKQYNMTNMLWLQGKGANFKNAYVGQMASETVVSHNTIVSGLFPKHMGWSDEVMRDVGDVLGYGAGAIVTVGDLDYVDYVKLIEKEDYPKLGDYMHSAFPGSIVANFGEKEYQVESTAASSSDYWGFMGGKKNTADLPDPSVVPWTGKYRGVGGTVPDYIANDTRFMISSGNSTDKYGTDVDKPAWLYPEDGRYHPGIYDDHVSGDAWVADAGMKVMEEEDWSAIHLNFSGIDKIGHMWGGGSVDNIATYNWDPASLMNFIHMPWIAKNADNQLGRLIAKLKELGQWDETLFVVLADHGATHADDGKFYGLDDYASAGYDSWYNDPTGLCANTAYGRPPLANPILQPLNDTENIAYTYQSTGIEAWLIDQGWGKKLEAAEAMDAMPGVIATYVRWHDRYVLVSTNPMTSAERIWWRGRAQGIVDAMASPTAADVVGLLQDHTNYSVFGDHGGAQKNVQRIPMVMYAQGMKHMTSTAAFRLADVMPTVLYNMGIKRIAPTDGRAYKLPL